MNVKDIIIRLINENMLISVPVTEASNLYTDLGFDSLAFISLLAQIEQALEVTFNISEMELCLDADKLIKTVENKIKERDSID